MEEDPWTRLPGLLVVLAVNVAILLLSRQA